MKKVILLFVSIATMSTLIVISCNKAKDVSSPKSVDRISKTETEKINIANADNDWKLIASKNIEIVDKFVNSNIDVNSFNFDSEAEFLKVIGKTKAQYLYEVNNVKAAANRMAAKYNIKNEGNSCTTCNVDKNEELAKLKRTLNLFKNNKVAFTKFKTLLIDPNYAIGGGGEDVSCCGWRFYACVTFCAASIEIFPVYLMCCAICYDTYCCKAP